MLPSMTSSGRVTHGMAWSATGTLLMFCYWHPLVLAIVAGVPAGAVALQPQAFGVAGPDARWTLGVTRHNHLDLVLPQGMPA